MIHQKQSLASSFNIFVKVQKLYSDRHKPINVFSQTAKITLIVTKIRNYW